MEHDARFRLTVEDFHYTSNFVGMPNIVLIAKKQNVPGTGAGSSLEIFRMTEILRILADLYRKGNRIFPCFENGERSVRGTVVADDDLVGKPRLIGNAVELLL